MKTQLEWFKQAKADGHEWADKAIENLINSYEQIKDTSLANALLGAFEWCESPEGHEFWRNIHNSLK